MAMWGWGGGVATQGTSLPPTTDLPPHVRKLESAARGRAGELEPIYAQLRSHMLKRGEREKAAGKMPVKPPLGIGLEEAAALVEMQCADDDRSRQDSMDATIPVTAVGSGPVVSSRRPSIPTLPPYEAPPAAKAGSMRGLPVFDASPAYETGDVGGFGSPTGSIVAVQDYEGEPLSSFSKSSSLKWSGTEGSEGAIAQACRMKEYDPQYEGMEKAWLSVDGGEKRRAPRPKNLDVHSLDLEVPDGTPTSPFTRLTSSKKLGVSGERIRPLLVNDHEVFHKKRSSVTSPYSITGRRLLIQGDDLNLMAAPSKYEMSAKTDGWTCPDPPAVSVISLGSESSPRSLSRSSVSKRDWNGEFQALLEKEVLTPHDASEKARLLQDFIADFKANILPLARTIIEERTVKDHKKTINTVKVGGIAGGDKYCHNGFFFKFTNTEKTAELYGGYENAMKSASHERKGINAIIACQVPRLRAPLSMVVTHLGQRLWVSTQVPVNPGSLKYGSANAGQTVMCEEEAATLVDKVGAVLNLKPHYVGPRGYGALTLLCTPVDLEVHQSSDGRYYVLDTARLFPPEEPKGGCPSGYLYRLLRPEFVRKYKTPLSSDAFSQFGYHDQDIHNAEIVAATESLHKEVIPRLVSRLGHLLLVTAQEESQREAPLGALRPPLPVTQVMHQYGVNMRHLGEVFEAFVVFSAKNPLAHEDTRQGTITALLAEMVARAFKTLQQQQHAKLPPSNREGHRREAVNAFNRLLQGDKASKEYWETILIPKIESKFKVPTCWPQVLGEITFLDANAKTTTGNRRFRVNVDSLISSSLFYQIYHRACELLGVKWSLVETVYLRLGASAEPLFTLESLVAIDPVVKASDIAPLTEGAGLMKQGCIAEAEEFYLEELKSRELVIGEGPYLVPILNAMAVLYMHPFWKGSRHRDALALRRRVVKIHQDKCRKEKSTKASLQWADSLDTLGLLFEELGQMENAMQAFHTSDTLRGNAEGSISVPVALSKQRLAEVFLKLGMFVEAVRYGEAAVGILEKLISNGNDDRPYAHHLGNALDCAMEIQCTLGKWRGVVKRCQRALELRKTYVSPSHPDWIKTLLIDAHLKLQQCDFSDALESAQRAADIAKTSLGPTDRLTLTTVAVLAKAHRKLFSYSKCLELTSAALETAKGMGKQGLEFVAVACEYAKCYFHPYADKHASLNCENILRALEKYEAALEVLSSHTDKRRSPQYVVISTHMARCLLVLGRLREAEKRVEEALSTVRALGMEDRRARAALVMSGKIKYVTCNYSIAVSNYFQAISFAEREEGPDHSEFEACEGIEEIAKDHPSKVRKADGSNKAKAIIPFIPEPLPAALIEQIRVMASLSAFYLFHRNYSSCIKTALLAVELFDRVADGLECVTKPLQFFTDLILCLQQVNTGNEGADFQTSVQKIKFIVEQISMKEEKRQIQSDLRLAEIAAQRLVQEKELELVHQRERVDATVQQIKVFTTRRKYREALPLIRELIRLPGFSENTDVWEKAEYFMGKIVTELGKNDPLLEDVLECHRDVTYCLRNMEQKRELMLKRLTSHDNGSLPSKIRGLAARRSDMGSPRGKNSQRSVGRVDSGQPKERRVSASLSSSFTPVTLLPQPDPKPLPALPQVPQLPTARFRGPRSRNLNYHPARRWL